MSNTTVDNIDTFDTTNSLPITYGTLEAVRELVRTKDQLKADRDQLKADVCKMVEELNNQKQQSKIEVTHWKDYYLTAAKERDELEAKQKEDQGKLDDRIKEIAHLKVEIEYHTDEWARRKQDVIKMCRDRDNLLDQYESAKQDLSQANITLCLALDDNKALVEELEVLKSRPIKKEVPDDLRQACITGLHAYASTVDNYLMLLCTACRDGNIDDVKVAIKNMPSKFIRLGLLEAYLSGNQEVIDFMKTELRSKQ